MHLSVGMIVLSGEGSSRKSSKDDHQVSGVVGADRYSIASLCLFSLEAFKRKIVLLWQCLIFWIFKDLILVWMFDGLLGLLNVFLRPLIYDY